MFSGLDHINIETNNLEETVRFYEEVLGFENEVGPPFDFLGVWLYAGGNPVIHLIEGASPSFPKTDPIDHVAWIASDFEGVKLRLKEKIEL